MTSTPFPIDPRRVRHYGLNPLATVTDGDSAHAWAEARTTGLRPPTAPAPAPAPGWDDVRTAVLALIALHLRATRPDASEADVERFLGADHRAALDALERSPALAERREARGLIADLCANQRIAAVLFAELGSPSRRSGYARPRFGWQSVGTDSPEETAR